MSDAIQPTEAGEVPRPRPSRGLEILTAALAVAFMAGFLGMAMQIPLRDEAAAATMSARTWPTVLGASGLAVAVILLAVAITRPAPHRDDLESVAKGGPRRVILTLVLSIAFVALWSVQSVVLGGYRIQLFPIVAALYLLALLLVFGHRRWFGLIVFPIGLTAFIYVLFGIILRIPL